MESPRNPIAQEERAARTRIEAATPVGRYSIVQVGSMSYKIIRREDFATSAIGDQYRLAVYRLSLRNYRLDGAMQLAKKLNEHQDRDHTEDGLEWIG